MEISQIQAVLLWSQERDGCTYLLTLTVQTNFLRALFLLLV
jgi:hypothetical protein